MNAVAAWGEDWRLNWPVWLRGENLGFAVRTYAAAMLALALAFFLQLDSPVWSWLTVYIVAQPTPGMLLSKSVYRVIGTITGALLGIVLIALFAQMPGMFVFALATLVGVCTLLSHLLTNFRAYATVLAAYTAGIVAADSINDPNQVFFIAMARGSCILIGIACSITVTLLFAPHRSAHRVRSRLAEALKAAARRAAFPWQGPNEERLRMGKALLDEVIALNTEFDFAAAESASFRSEANRARSLLAHLFSIISARRSLDAHLERRGWPPHHALRVYHDVVLDFLNDLPGRLDRGEIETLGRDLGEIEAQLAVLHVEGDTDNRDDVVSERLVIDRMADLVGEIREALQDWHGIANNFRPDQPRFALNFHRDQRAACIHGLRAFVAVAATGAFWIGSAWTQGPGALIFVAIMLSLFSSMPRPDRFGWNFFLASIPAIPSGLVLKFWVLSSGSGFGYLMFSTALFLIPLGLLMAYPRTASFGVAFSIIFLNVSTPENQMTYDLADSINNALAIQVGVLFGTLAYLLIFPPDPVAARRYVTRRIRLGLQRLADLPRAPRFCDWESRMYDRVNRLHDPMNLSGTHTDEWLEAGLGALTLGNEVLRLRRLQERGSLEHAVKVPIDGVLEAFRHFEKKSPQAREKVRQAIHQLLPLDPGPGQGSRLEWARTVGAMEEIDFYLGRHSLLRQLERN